MGDAPRGCLAVQDYDTDKLLYALRPSMALSRVKDQDVAQSGPALTLPNICVALAGG